MFIFSLTPPATLCSGFLSFQFFPAVPHSYNCPEGRHDCTRLDGLFSIPWVTLKVQFNLWLWLTLTGCKWNYRLNDYSLGQQHFSFAHILWFASDSEVILGSCWNPTNIGLYTCTDQWMGRMSGVMQSWSLWESLRERNCWIKMKIGHIRAENTFNQETSLVKHGLYRVLYNYLEYI